MGSLTSFSPECYRPAFLMRHRFEYVPVWLIVSLFRVLPRGLARMLGIGLGYSVYLLHPRLRHVGYRNLRLALPEKSKREHRKIVRGVFRTLGRQLADFCQFPSYDGRNIETLAVYEGFECYDSARARGKGVLFVTAHLGGWEIGSFAHAIYGNSMQVVVRPLDNPYLDRLVNGHRTLHGNKTFGKQEFARGLISAMRAGETVGLLMDQNMTPPQGVFVDFFGVPACSASGIARVAMKTDAAVVPAFTIWDPVLRKYRVHFDPAVALIRTGNHEADVIANTAKFTKVIEEFVRKYPDQWLWVHKRWKTRPPGESPLY
jgi:Kdo2-lipid IVA lauroyltransferase/acyltransferase